MLDLFNSNPIKFEPQDAKLIYHPNFFSNADSKKYYMYLKDKILWKQDSIKFYGKEHPLPRLTAWYGDANKIYTYSGIKQKPNKWTKELLIIKGTVEECFNVQFNSLLLNYYRDGNDVVSWHSDDEKELGSNITIGSVSFGAKRDFQLKHKTNDNIDKINIELDHGSCLMMFPPTQKFWLHQIPKRKKVFEPRINLTFRYINQ